MSRLTEYLAVVAIGLAIVAFVIIPVARAVSASLEASAARIQEATNAQ